MNEINVDKQDAQQNKLYAILAYIGIFFIIPLIAAKNSKFAQYHANQGLSQFIVLFVLGIVVGIISALSPSVGSILMLVDYLIALIFMILGIVHAVKGEAKPLPVIGNLFHFIKSY